MTDIRCSTCQYAKKHFTHIGNTRYSVFCEYPDMSSVVKYFIDKRMAKAVGFLGYRPKIETPDNFPVKTAPKWCPRKTTKE